MIDLLVGDKLTVVNSDLMSMVVGQPLDISDDDIDVYMGKLTDEQAEDQTQWLKIGMALYHQYQGSDEGWEKFDTFSKRSTSNYDHDANLRRWNSFGNRTTSTPVTFASVITMAGGKIALNDAMVESLEEKAEGVCDKHSYLSFRDEVSMIGKSLLSDDLRAMLAATVTARVGKDLGITKTEVKKAFSPVKKIKANNNADARPEWCDHWVYVETQCEFASTKLNYSIKREAFNAKYDRESECVFAEKTAATLALVDYDIDTVVDVMYWPSASTIFEYEGKSMLNKYADSGAKMADSIDDDGQNVIDMLIKHVEFTIEDARERRILMDWLAYVVQNKGERVSWALLLQGSQGTGKSYFVNLLQCILGSNVSNLDGSAIAGRFTGWAHGSRVVAVEEIRISGANKYEVLDRMKPFISNKTVQIEEKGRDHRTVPNFTSYLLLTNYKDSIPIIKGDRRYCVLFSRIQSEEALFDELGGELGAGEYFNHLFDETERRADALAYFLMNYKISEDFNPKGRAPSTDSRDQMMNVAVSPIRSMIEDMIEEHDSDVINADILDVTRLNELIVLDGNEPTKGNILTSILLELGYSSIRNRRIKIKETGRYHYIWHKPKYNEYEVAAKVRKFYEKK